MSSSHTDHVGYPGVTARRALHRTMMWTQRLALICLHLVRDVLVHL